MKDDNQNGIVSFSRFCMIVGLFRAHEFSETWYGSRGTTLHWAVLKDYSIAVIKFSWADLLLLSSFLHFWIQVEISLSVVCRLRITVLFCIFMRSSAISVGNVNYSLLRCSSIYMSSTWYKATLKSNFEFSLNEICLRCSLFSSTFCAILHRCFSAAAAYRVIFIM